MTDLPPPPYTRFDTNLRTSNSPTNPSVSDITYHPGWDAGLDVTADGSREIPSAPLKEKAREAQKDKNKKAKASRRDGAHLGEALYEAVSKCDAKIVGMLLDHGANCNFRPSCAKPALTIAVGKNSLEIAKMLLERGEPDIEARPPAGETALYTAVSKGYTHMVALLLQCGANVNAKPDGGKPALFVAYKKERKSIVETLLQAPDLIIDATPPGGVATLWHAAENGDTKVLHMLLSKGAKVDVKPPGGSTAMYRAAVRQDSATAGVLLQHGADVNASPPGGTTALWHAASKGDESMVRLLLMYNADTEVKPPGGKTALTQAIKKGNSEVTRILLEHGEYHDRN